MAWRRIAKDHWSNDSDKHLFYDAETKLLCTEVWQDGKFVSMVVVPKTVLEDLLKENRYYLFPEAELESIQRLMDNLIDSVGEEVQELDWYKDALRRREAKTNSLTQLVMHAEKRFEAALQVVEIDDHKILALTAEVNKLKAGLRIADQNKMKIIEVANKEINGLRDEVKRLKEKCGEQ